MASNHRSIREPEIVGWSSLTEDILQMIVDSNEAKRPIIIHVPSTKGGGGSRVVRDIYQELAVSHGWPPLTDNIDELTDLLEIRNEIFAPRRSGLRPNYLIWFPIELSAERAFEEAVLSTLNRYDEELKNFDSVRSATAGALGKTARRYSKKYAVDFATKLAVSTIPLGETVLLPFLKALPDLRTAFTREGGLSRTTDVISGMISDHVAELLRSFSHKTPVIVVIDAGNIDESAIRFIRKLIGKSINNASEAPITILITSNDADNLLDSFPKRVTKKIPLLDNTQAELLAKQFEHVTDYKKSIMASDRMTPLEVLMNAIDGDGNHYQRELRRYRKDFNKDFYVNFVALVSMPEIPQNLWQRALPTEMKTFLRQSLTDLNWGGTGPIDEGASLIEAGIRPIHRDACRVELSSLPKDSVAREAILAIQYEATDSLLSEVPEDIGEVYAQLRTLLYRWSPYWPESLARILSALNLYSDREYLLQATQITNTAGSYEIENNHEKFVHDLLNAVYHMNCGNFGRSISYLSNALNNLPSLRICDESYEFVDLLCSLPQQVRIGNANILDLLLKFRNQGEDLSVSSRSRLRVRIRYFALFALGGDNSYELESLNFSKKKIEELLLELKAEFESELAQNLFSVELDLENYVWADKVDPAKVLFFARQKVLNSFNVENADSLINIRNKSLSVSDLEMFAHRLEKLSTSHEFLLIKEAVVETIQTLEIELGIYRRFNFGVRTDQRREDKWHRADSEKKSVLQRIVRSAAEMIRALELDEYFLSSTEKYQLAASAVLCEIPDSRRQFETAHDELAKECIVDMYGLLSYGTEFLFRNTSGAQDRRGAIECLCNLFRYLESETNFLDENSRLTWIEITVQNAYAADEYIPTSQIETIFAEYCPNTYRKMKLSKLTEKLFIR